MGFLQKINQMIQSKKEEEEKRQKNTIRYLTPERRLIGQQLLSKFLENDYNLEVATQDQKLFCILVILEKKIEERSTKEIKILAKLTENIKFFKEVRLSENGHHIHEQLCKHLIPRSYEANTVLFNQGDHGEEFWIVLKGEAKVMKREFVEFGQGEQLQDQKKKDQKDGDDINNVDQFSSNQKISSIVKNPPASDGPIQGEFQQVEKVRLGPGNCFGELALVSEGENRKATVETTEDSEFAIIMKDDFLKIVKVISQNSVFIERFASMPLFSQLNYNQIKCLYDICYEKEFRLNNVIYSEGDVPEEIYFIKSGEFVQKIVKKDEYHYQICDQSSDLINVLNQQLIQQKGNDRLISGNQDKKINLANQTNDESLNLLLPNQAEQDPQNEVNKRFKQNILEKQIMERATEQHLQIYEDTLLGELMLHKNQKSKSKKFNPSTNHMKSDQFITLKIMSKGECFGEEELLIKKNKDYRRVTTVICSSDQGSLYCFNKKDFLRRLFNDDTLMKIFKNQLQVKKEQRAFQLQKFSETHNSHAKIFDIQSNVIRVARNCDLVEDFEEKEHCFIKPPRINYKSHSTNSPLLQAQTPLHLLSQQSNTNDNLSVSSSGQVSPIPDLNFSKSIRKGQTEDLVIEEIYQNNNEQQTNNSLSKFSQSKPKEKDSQPVQRNALKILQQSTQYSNKKAYIGSIRKSQGIIILQQEYLRQFYEKYNIPEQDLYSKDITNGIKKSKQIPTTSDGQSTNRRMNEQKKDQKQNLVNQIRFKQKSQDIKNTAITVNSPLSSSQKQETGLTTNDRTSFFFPNKTSGFKDFVASLSNDKIVEKQSQQQLKDPEQSSMAQRRRSSQCPSQQNETDYSRRNSDGISTESKFMETPRKKNYTIEKLPIQNQNSNLQLHKFSLSQLGASAEQLTERGVALKRKSNSEVNPLSFSEMFNHKGSLKILSHENQPKGNQNISHRDLQHNLLQQNLITNQYKNTFHQSKSQFEEVYPKGKFFTSQGVSLQGLVKTKKLENIMKYSNPIIQMHQEYIEHSKNEKPAASLHSKSEQLKINLNNNQSQISSTSSHKEHLQLLSPLKLLPNVSQSESINLQNSVFENQNYLSSRSEICKPFNKNEGQNKTDRGSINQNQFNASMKLYSNVSTQQGGANQQQDKEQQNSSYFNVTDREFKSKIQPKKHLLDINKLPLKYKLNQIVQTKDRKVIQGKLKQYIPQISGTGAGILQSSAIHLQNRQKHSSSQEYLPHC